MARRFHLHAVVGRGTGTTVYRATELGVGASVALKVLDHPDPPPSVLARLRDEARILASLRDIPAFVRAEPPIRLEGRWVAILELVPGNTAFSLLRHGPFPPAAAAEVIGAVATALAAAWDHPGPGGPVRLVHRDLKPGNLQITPDGAVRILDLGIASAALPDRETRTGAFAVGTLGYLAPERIRGVNAPAGDVYALGVVLAVLTTRETPARIHSGADSPPDDRALLSLAGAMRAADPADRPGMRELAARVEALAGQLPGPGLAAWAQLHVRPLEGSDPHCGRTWAEPSWWRRLLGS